VAAIGISAQCLHVFYQSGTKRVQMDVSNKFEQVGLFLAKYRFVTILKKVAMTAVPSVKIDGMPGQ
jgi:hypothetical protein